MGGLGGRSPPSWNKKQKTNSTPKTKNFDWLVEVYMAQHERAVGRCHLGEGFKCARTRARAQTHSARARAPFRAHRAQI